MGAQADLVLAVIIWPCGSIVRSYPESFTMVQFPSKFVLTLSRNDEDVYGNKDFWAGVANRNRHTNTTPDRRDLIAESVGDGKYVFRLAGSYEDMYSNHDGWVGYTARGHHTNDDSRRREWYVSETGQGTYIFTLPDGRQLYSNPKGWLGVTWQGSHSNTERARREFRIQAA